MHREKDHSEMKYREKGHREMNHHEKNHRKVRRLALLGISAAAAIILGYIDNMIILLVSVPGVKLGLANLIGLLLLYTAGAADAFLVTGVRILVLAFLFPNFTSALFSLAAGIGALAVMVLCRRFALFDMTGTSISGAFVHNMVQLLLAVFVTGSKAVLYYFPVLSFTAVLTGAAIGFLGGRVLRTVRKNQ